VKRFRKDQLESAAWLPERHRRKADHWVARPRKPLSVVMARAGGHPVRRGLSAQVPVSLEYWITRMRGWWRWQALTRWIRLPQKSDQWFARPRRPLSSCPRMRASSTPRPLPSSTGVSGILDHPHARV